MIGILALTDLAIGARAISGLATVVGVERMRMIYVMTRGMITAYMTHVPEVVQRLTNAGYWVRLGILWGIELAMTIVSKGNPVPMNVLMVSRRRMNAREACRRKMSAICTSPNRMSVMGVLPGVIRGGVRSGLTVVSCLINVILIVPRISRNKRRI